MKNAQSIQIEIPSPCSQNWDDMTPQGQGRHCDSCRKTVIDFTTWSDSELYGFFANNKDHLCGRFLSTQVGRQIHVPHQPHSRLYKMAMAMGLTLMFVHTPEVRAQSKPPMIASSMVTGQADTVKHTGKTDGELRGTVTDGKKEPLVNASIQVLQNGVVKGGTVTDFDGMYSIKGLDSGSYELKVSYVGYKIVTQPVMVAAGNVVSVKTVLPAGTSQLGNVRVRMGLINKRMINDK